MADFNIFDNYVPTLSSIPDDKLLEIRNRLVDYLKELWGDVDSRPNTPFGDLFLSPGSAEMAALEVALSRVRSDLNMRNVEDGVIYDCNFVRDFLKNLGSSASSGLPATGVIRMTFSKDQACTIDKSTKFRFGTGNVFQLRLFHDGPLEVRVVGDYVAFDDSNNVVLVPISENLYVVDVPVMGTMTTPVPKGTAGELTQVIDCLESVVALIDFTDGAETMSLPQLAKRTRETIYSASLTSRNGAINYLRSQFMELTNISPVVPGDAEQLRLAYNALGVFVGGMDLYIRSAHFGLEDKHTIRIDYDPVTETFIGEFAPAEIPVKITKIVPKGLDTVEIDIGTEALLWAKSTNTTKVPLLTSGFSSYESYWLTVEMPTLNAAPMISLLEDTETGRSYAYFDVTYITDPALKIVADHLVSRDAVGVNTVCRGFVLVDIRKLYVRYRRDSGKTVNLEQARTEIYNYFRSVGGIGKYFSKGPIIDSMFYAGVQDVVAIDCEATVMWSAAHRVVTDTGEMPIDTNDDFNLVDATTDALTPYVINITSADGLIPEYIDHLLGQAGETYASVGKRNVAYLLNAENIIFNEL